jgi:hypothetical protein
MRGFVKILVFSFLATVCVQAVRGQSTETSELSSVYSLLFEDSKTQLFYDAMDLDRGWQLAAVDARTESLLIVNDGVMRLQWFFPDPNANVRTEVSAMLPIAAPVDVNRIEWAFTLSRASNNLFDPESPIIGSLIYDLHYGKTAIRIVHNGTFDAGLSAFQTPAVVKVRYNVSTEKVEVRIDNIIQPLNASSIPFTGISSLVEKNYSGPSFFRIIAGEDIAHLPRIKQGLVEVSDILIESSDQNLRLD